MPPRMIAYRAWSDTARRTHTIGVDMDFDPQSHELQDDPYPVYRALRETHPVFFSPQGRFWAISRYDDVLEALSRPEMFSSRRSLGEPAPDDPSAYMPMIVILDPPRHDELRAMVSRAFTPRRIAALEPRIRAITAELIDGFITHGRCDLFRELSLRCRRSSSRSCSAYRPPTARCSRRSRVPLPPASARESGRQCGGRLRARRLPRRDVRREAPATRRRFDERVARGRDRRTAARAAGAARLCIPPPFRRQRDHDQPDRQRYRAARPLPGSAPALGRQSRPDPHRSKSPDRRNACAPATFVACWPYRSSSRRDDGGVVWRSG